MRSYAKLYFKSLFISFALFGLSYRSYAEKSVKLKFQDWNEDDDRIRVRSWYAQANTSINSSWDISVTGMVDSISGATPWGTPPTQNKDDWLVTLNERREAGIISLSSAIDDYDFSIELGRSKESDYLSRSYALTTSRGFAEDTLTLSTGLSYLDDDVNSDVPGGPGLGILSRKTPEIFLGVHRIIDPKTTFSLNLTYGRPEGYLSDPYKQIGRNEPLFSAVWKKIFLYSKTAPTSVILLWST